MEAGDKSQLGRRLAEGRVILFTGAGFSLGATSVSHVPVPGVDALRRLLWPLAFPTDAVDEASSLADVYDVAAARAGNAVEDLLRNHLTVDHASLPGDYRLWFSLPWYRHYTLNVDDLDEQVGRAGTLPRRVRSVSALRDSFVAAGPELLSVHLNGRARDYPDVTFSARQFAKRLAQPDEWYQALTADLLSHPVVFVGSTLDEPTLWQHIELRRGRGQGGRELRPASYLVSPDLPAARAAMLKRYNVTWIKATGRDFANEVLAEMHRESELGHAAITRQFAASPSSSLLVPAADLRAAKPPQDGAAYLLGRQPTAWDVTDGFAITRAFERDLEECSLRLASSPVLLLTGTAGSGKSTTLLRLAFSSDAAGRRVYLLDTEASYGPSHLREALTKAAPEVLVVDDLYTVGRQVAEVIADWLTDDPQRKLFAAARGTGIPALEPDGALGRLARDEQPVPHLADSDIGSLLDALAQGKRLGVLAGKSREQQVRAFRERAGRQLIVALIEATSGLKFEEKLSAECDELETDARFLYAAASLATARGFGLAQEDLILAFGTADNAVLNHIQTLVRRGLLVQGTGRQMKVRHRVVADRVVEHLRAGKELTEPLRGLLFAAASKADRQASRRSKEWRLLISIINHDYLQRLLLDLGEVRQCYAEVENLLYWDYHYWLQRGSLEVESGNLEHAFNFLSQARGLAPDDYKVQTEWAYFELKNASSDSTRSGAVDRAEAALVELEDVIRRRGETDAYAYHVYGSQGLRWARRAPMSTDDRARLLDRLRRLVAEGVRRHPRQGDLKQLSDDLQKEYLSLAVAR